jgi:hypothetical protein
MIEIKITIDSALTLLLERMNLEIKIRQRDMIIPKGWHLEELSFKQLLSIAEASVFDTVFLLPIDLVSQETNLVNIITGTVRALSRIFRKEEFNLYSTKQAQKLIQPIINHFQSQLRLKNFSNN